MKESQMYGRDEAEASRLSPRRRNVRGSVERGRFEPLLPVTPAYAVLLYPRSRRNPQQRTARAFLLGMGRHVRNPRQNKNQDMNINEAQLWLISKKYVTLCI